MNDLCRECANTIPGRGGPGWNGPDGLVLFCSFSCRGQYVAKHAAAAGPGVNGLSGPIHKPGARNAEKGVARSGGRKLTAAEIIKNSRPLESAISTAIGNRLTAAGFWNTRTQSGQIKTASGHLMKLCRSGTPDRIAAAGVMVWIEVKREGETASEKQKQAMAELRANGSLAFVLDNVADLEFILAGLRRHAAAIAGINAATAAIQIDIDAAIAAAKVKP